VASESWTRKFWERIAGWVGGKTEDTLPPLPLRRDTFVYTQKAGQDLELDVYRIDTAEETAPWATFLYFHGGGFSEGSRREARYVQFMEKLARLGYVAVAASYHLSMKGKSMSCDQLQSRKITAFRSAAEDVWAATRYLIEHAEELNILPHSIILAGSSAGAEAVVNAVYWPEGEMGLEKRDLPLDFAYAGLLSMAGAILELDWIKSENAIPSLLFHGEDDPLVPYGSHSHHYCRPDQPGYLPLYGAGSIAAQLKQLGCSYHLITGLEGGHGWADKPMFDHVDLIEDFFGAQDGRRVEERWKWR
jgi:acetyl esterase/lipase